MVTWPLLAAGEAGGVGFPEFAVGGVDEYLTAVTRALMLQAGTNTESLFLEASLESQLGRKDEAERLARRALELDSRRPDIHLFLANIFIRQDRLDAAVESLRQALRLDPNLPGAQRQLGMVLDRLGEPEGAHEAFVAAARLAPGDATTRLLLGRWLLDQERVEEAVVELREACRLDPESANAHYALFQAQSRSGDRETAQRTLERFQDLRQADKTASDSRLETFDNDQQMREMAALFHTSAAGLLLRQAQPALAEAHLRQAQRIAPDAHYAHEMLGDLLIRQQRFDEARSAYETLVRLRPGQSAYRLNLATLLLQLKDYPPALREFEAVLALDPQQPQALNNLTRLYLGSNRELARALTLCQRLVALEPSAANYDLLGWALFANGRTQEAIAAATRAVAADPSNPVYRERLGRLEQRTGKAP